MNFRKKLIVILLAIVYIFGCAADMAMLASPVMSANAEEAVTILTVNGSEVNVRSGPGTSYSKIGSIAAESTHTVIGTEKDSDGVDWYKINLDGQTGYVISTYCTLSTITAPAPTSAQPSTATSSSIATSATTTVPTLPAEDVLLITGTVVSVRASASSSADRVAVVRRGETFSVISSAKDSGGKVWYCISTGKTQGYVSSDHAALTAAYTSQLASITVTAPIVNLRSDAGTDHSKIGTVRRGDVFNVITSVKDSAGKVWYKIEAAGKTGYICSDYVTVKAAVTTTTTTTTTVIPTTTTTKAVGSGSSVRKVTTGKVTTESTYLNVRSGAGTDYGVIGKVNNGTTVTILGTSGNWYKIEYNCSKGYGYVSSDYISNVKTESTLVTLAFGTSYYYVNVGSTVKLSASASGYTVTYSSDDPTNAPIDASTGTATGKTPGMYTITARSGDMSATAQLVVLKAPYTGIQHMTVSDEAVKFISEWEGGHRYDSTLDALIFEPYKDSAGFWTVGYGHAKTTSESKRWSKARAIAEFNKDITELIGAEHIITDDKPYLTEEESFALLKADLNDGVYVSAVSNWAVRNGVKLTQSQFDALVSFCFNLGPSYFMSDTNQIYLKSAILCQRSGDDADPDDIIYGFTLYIKAGGENLRGLWWRRRNEAEMFLEGDYAVDRENKFTPPNLSWGG